MNIKEILSHCDHTLLRQDAAWQEIREICDDAVHYGTASVCIPPSFVKPAADYLQGRVPVCTVIGFPNGYMTTRTKAFEAKEAIENGASEIDMVINIGWLKDRQYDRIEKEIRTLKAVCGERILKVIIETCLLTEEEKVRMCGIVTAAGADYIKTSTGFSTGGATFADVALMAAHVGERVRIKAAGGIGSLEDARKFLELGADRLGTSRIVKIVKALEEKYHLCQALNDEKVLSFYTKKPIDLNGRIFTGKEREELIRQFEEDFEYSFRAIKAPDRQVHSDRVVAITEENLYEETGPADGLVTDLRGVALKISTADCQSIFLYDPVRGVIANVHSGWRGTLQRIVLRAVEMMTGRYGCRAEDIRAYFNPSILGCSFEVEDDVIAMFQDKMDAAPYYKKDRIADGRQKYLLDTVAVNRDALLEAGLKKEHIMESGIGTFCSHDEYYSYRADGRTDGRNGSVICLR